MPGAGTTSGLGTVPLAINPSQDIAGFYSDPNVVLHSFVRAHDGSFTTFDAPGAGTGFGQGTFVAGVDGITPSGTTAGYYLDDNNVHHGWVRAPDGVFTTFDVAGAGTNEGQGTIDENIGLTATTTGWYIDSNGVIHAFLRTPSGVVTEFNAPGAGTGAGQGTLAGGITPAGTVVCAYSDANGTYHGCVRDRFGVIKSFDVPGAGTGAGQGTEPSVNNPAGTITGSYVDAAGVYHGFLWIP